MQIITYSHRFADIIINSEYSLRVEIENILNGIDVNQLISRYDQDNYNLMDKGRNAKKGMQYSLNNIFRENFELMGWENEKNVFDSPDNDLRIDYWKRKIGVEVAFNHRSFIGGDLLRLQAAAEVKDIINLGVYICATKEFAKHLSKNASSLVCYERVKWYLENLYGVLTVPIWLIGLKD